MLLNKLCRPQSVNRVKTMSVEPRYGRFSLRMSISSQNTFFVVRSKDYVVAKFGVRRLNTFGDMVSERNSDKSAWQNQRGGQTTAAAAVMLVWILLPHPREFLNLACSPLRETKVDLYFTRNLAH